MFPLANYPETNQGKNAHSVALAYSGDSRHGGSNKNFFVRNVANIGVGAQLILGCFQPLFYCDADVLDGLLAGFSLRAAAWQVVTPNGPPFLGFDKRDAIFHARNKPCFRHAVKSCGFLRLVAREGCGAVMRETGCGRLVLSNASAQIATHGNIFNVYTPTGWSIISGNPRREKHANPSF